MSDISYSSVAGVIDKNPIVPGLAWTTHLDMTSDEDWLAADETVANWLFKIDNERLGGKATIEINPTAAVIDGTNSKILTLKLDIPAAKTTGLLPEGKRGAATWGVSVRHKVGSEWYPFGDGAGTVSIINEYGEGNG